MATSPSTRTPAAPMRVTVVREDGASRRREQVAGEEPLEIRAQGPGQDPVRVAVTMRTPGNDYELAAGFLYGEGLITPDDIATIRYCTPAAEEQRYNVLSVDLRRAFDPGTFERNFYAASSCGVCGKASIDSIEVRCDVLHDEVRVPSAVIASLPETLRGAQRLFDATGGLHATGLFTLGGELLAAREDVGRHNAMDKLIGHELLEGRLPLAERIVLVSGRASFELVQKVAVAGAPIMCAVSAPSTLAVETARRLGVTLVGFLREDRFTIYAHGERIEIAGGG
jgi:FdhD protein